MQLVQNLSDILTLLKSLKPKLPTKIKVELTAQLQARIKSEFPLLSMN